MSATLENLSRALKCMWDKMEAEELAREKASLRGLAKAINDYRCRHDKLGGLCDACDRAEPVA